MSTPYLAILLERHSGFVGRNGTAGRDSVLSIKPRLRPSTAIEAPEV